MVGSFITGAVGHVDLGNQVWPHMYAKTLREEKGYITGLFGKCMNGTCRLSIGCQRLMVALVTFASVLVTRRCISQEIAV